MMMLRNFRSTVTGSQPLSPGSATAEQSNEPTKMLTSSVSNKRSTASIFHGFSASMARGYYRPRPGDEKSSTTKLMGLIRLRKFGSTSLLPFTAASV